MSLVPFLLTLIGFVSTGIGGCLAVIAPDGVNFTILNAMTAGVMIFLSVFHLVPEAAEDVGNAHALLSFFVGFVFFAGIAAILSMVNLDESEAVEILVVEGGTNNRSVRERYLRAALVVSVGLAMHNVFEGAAVYLAGLKGVEFGAPLALAISFHNLPEGISVAVPVFAATGSRWRAISWAFISGIFEPVGALVCMSIATGPVEDDEGLLALSLSGTAGVMFFISIHEILPLALQPGATPSSNWTVTLSLLFGMVFCWLSVEAINQMSGGES